MTEATRADTRRFGGFLRCTPQGRVDQPDEIAALAVFLVSSMASYINSVTLAVCWPTEEILIPWTRQKGPVVTGPIG
ncbi:hypothetical protein PSQ20_20545 [Curvibacter sp. RS43]|nr:hypothetical protein [Curvibacter sp. RS43]MDD0812745.1 hypothetical protein [Curvibacter sp. RS43]